MYVCMYVCMYVYACTYVVFRRLSVHVCNSGVHPEFYAPCAAGLYPGAAGRSLSCAWLAGWGAGWLAGAQRGPEMPREAQRGPERPREISERPRPKSGQFYQQLTYWEAAFLKGPNSRKKASKRPLVAPSQKVASFISNSHIGKPLF